MTKRSKWSHRDVIRILCVSALLLHSVSSFQGTNNAKTLTATAWRGTQANELSFRCREKPYPDRSQVLVCGTSIERTTFQKSFLSNGMDQNSPVTKNKDYDDIAFGFIFLGGYITTQDIFFTATFLLLSAIAAIATRGGQLPATKSIPAAVAGFTLLISLALPKEQLYGLLPFLEKAEPSLPVDPSLIHVGLCAVSMIYGFLSSDDENNNSIA